MKFVSVILFLGSFSFDASAQCNTKVLDNRKYDSYKTTKERNLNIRVIAAMTYKLVESVGNKASEMGTYVKSTLKNGGSPNIQKYIDHVAGLKKSLSKETQTKETMVLDKLTYCYYEFIEEGYKKIQIALRQKNTDKLIEEYQKATGELALGIDSKGNPLFQEIKRLYAAYPIQK